MQSTTPKATHRVWQLISWMRVQWHQIRLRRCMQVTCPIFDKQFFRLGRLIPEQSPKLRKDLLTYADTSNLFCGGTPINPNNAKTDRPVRAMHHGFRPLAHAGWSRHQTTRLAPKRFFINRNCLGLTGHPCWDTLHCISTSSRQFWRKYNVARNARRHSQHNAIHGFNFTCTERRDDHCSVLIQRYNLFAQTPRAFGTRPANVSVKASNPPSTRHDPSIEANPRPR
ncbi:Hypothetical protein FKW44_004906 [Caligus rogercresseyi]|uniref:Uncharacterized protein n=1 Tax=Caligus rogercresseyi TaxID=217165 RepID=A0A7T8HND0_CALRO|nr:Hypothetical protein FKW44_004906 [Caligus rogercresseyi]